jgi:hypothetical protein
VSSLSASTVETKIRVGVDEVSRLTQMDRFKGAETTMALPKAPYEGRLFSRSNEAAVENRGFGSNKLPGP